MSDDLCPECGNERHEGSCDEEKDFGTILDELIEHGYSDEEIFNQLVNGYGYSNHAPEFLIALIRVAKEKGDWPSFPTGDLTAYLELAREAFHTDYIYTVADRLDLSIEELDRLRDQLERYMNKEKEEESADE